MDIRLPRVVFKQRAHQRKRSHAHRDEVGNYDPDGAAEQHDEQRLRKELGFDVPFPSAESPPQTDFANALIDRDEHDVHDADAPNPERQNTDEDKQHLQTDGDAVDDGPKLFATEHLDRLLVGGRKLLARGESGENPRLGARLELRRDGFKYEHTAVLRVPKVTRRGIGNPRRFVVAREVVAQLDLAVHGADHRKPHACNDDRFADCGGSAEQLLAYACSQKNDPAPLEFVERVDPATLRRLFVAHISVFRANAADGRRADHAISVGNARTAHGLETRVAYIVGGLFNHVDVGLFENDFLARALAAGLFASLLRPADDGAFAEGVEATDKNFAEAAAVCDQQCDGGDSPHNAEHGERAASAVALQRRPGFVQDLINHAHAHASHLPHGARLRWDQWRRRGVPDTERTGWRWVRDLPWPPFPSAMSASGRRRSRASAAG